MTTMNTDERDQLPPVLKLWICCHCGNPRLCGSGECKYCGAQLHDTGDYSVLDSQAAGNESTERLFTAWWAANHPWDWWAKDRNGKPLAHDDRLLVTELVKRAFYAADALKLVTATAMRDLCVEKVKAIADDYRRLQKDNANIIAHHLDGVATQLESLTLDQVKEKQS